MILDLLSTRIKFFGFGSLPYFFFFFGFFGLIGLLIVYFHSFLHKPRELYISTNRINNYKRVLYKFLEEKKNYLLS